MIEVLDRLYAEEYGCHFTAIVPSNIYGPYDNYEIEGGHVVPGLIHKFYKAKRVASRSVSGVLENLFVSSSTMWIWVN